MAIRQWHVGTFYIFSPSTEVCVEFSNRSWSLTRPAFVLFCSQMTSTASTDRRVKVLIQSNESMPNPFLRQVSGCTYIRECQAKRLRELPSEVRLEHLTRWKRSLHKFPSSCWSVCNEECSQKLCMLVTKMVQNVWSARVELWMQKVSSSLHSRSCF